MSTVAKLLARLELDTSGFQKGLGSIPGMLNRVGGDFSQIGGAITAGVTLPLLAVGAAAVAVGGHALQVGADFEKAMSGVNAILGASQEEVQKLNDLALNLGMSPDLIVSASQAAGVMEELAKNGLTADDILGGAAESAIALANATGTDFATAADIASTSMSLFNIQASEMDRVVNSITAGANSSRFSAEDFAMAIAMGGGMAQAVGVKYEDFITAIAGLSSSFSSGSDAGTSFKTFLQRLVPDTKSAIEAMTELGIITDEGQNQFFTAAGELKSMSEIAGVLQQALSGLNDEQKILALTNMFGTDAMRAANAMAELGAEGFDSLAESMAKADAAANAATRMDNLAGAWEIMTGVIEGFQIKFTQAIGPHARQLVEVFTGFLDKNATRIDDIFTSLSDLMVWLTNDMSNWFDKNGSMVLQSIEKFITALPEIITKVSEVAAKLTPVLDKMFNAFMSMDPQTIANIVQAIGALAILGPVFVILGSIFTTISSIISLGGALWGVISGLASAFWTASVAIGGFITGGILLPLLVIIGTLALVYLAFKNNFMGITTTAQQLWFIITWGFQQAIESIKLAFTNGFAFIQQVVEELKYTFTLLFEDGSGLLLNLATAFGFPAEAAQNFLATVFAVCQGIQNAIQGVIVKVMELAAKLLGIKLPKALTPGSPTPFENGLVGIANAMDRINNTGLSGITQVAVPNAPSLSSSNNQESAMGGGLGSKTVQINITNPKKETSEESIQKTLNKLSFLRVLE